MVNPIKPRQHWETSVPRTHQNSVYYHRCKYPHRSAGNDFTASRTANSDVKPPGNNYCGHFCENTLSPGTFQCNIHGSYTQLRIRKQKQSCNTNGLIWQPYYCLGKVVRSFITFSSFSLLFGWRETYAHKRPSFERHGAAVPLPVLQPGCARA